MSRLDKSLIFNHLVIHTVIYQKIKISMKNEKNQGFAKKYPALRIGVRTFVYRASESGLLSQIFESVL
jgi:hypothetical protein